MTDAPSVESTGAEFGTYGLRIPGLPGAAPWMQWQPAGAPSLRVGVTVGAPGDGPSHYDAVAADLRLLGGGRLRARRGASEVDYVLPAVPPDADLLHPYLAPAAALVWRWRGREAVHGGVFSGRDGAVLLLGGKEAGKSTTLAWLASAGVPVLADDLAVLDGTQVLAGPQSIDLRSRQTVPSARFVRHGDRQRVTLPPTAPSLPLGGVAVLDWGERVAVTAVPVDERWGVLAAQRSFPALEANAMTLLDLVSVPTFRVTRPPGLSSVAATGEALMETFGR